VNEQPEVGTVSERLHALDLVRSLALLLGIVFHAALPLLPDYQAWLIMDSQRSWPIAWAAFATHSFRMAIFFLLAGFFGHMMLHRKGTKAFVWDRVKRIALPLIVFWFPLLMALILALAFAASQGAIPPLPAEQAPLTVAAFPLVHLWFLYILVLLYAATLLLRSLVALADRGGGFRRLVDRVTGELLRFPYLMPVALAVPVGLLLQHHDNWVEWWGVPTPDVGLVPNLAALATFALAFWTGWLVHRLKDGLTPLAPLWVVYVPSALVLTAVCLALTKGPDFVPQFSGDKKLIFAALYALMLWLWTFGLIGMALRFIRKESRWVRYLADSSYWLYIIHLPLLLAIEGVVAIWVLPAELKLVLVVAMATSLMLLTYHWLVRFTWLGAWLNGRRRKRGTA